jgi:hypothetical protein
MSTTRLDPPRHRSGLIMLVLLILAGTALQGCTYLPKPSEPHPASKEQVMEQWNRLRAEPAELERPVLVFDGWVPTGGGHAIADHIRALTGNGKDMIVLKTNYLFGSAEGMAHGAVKLVEKRWPCDDPEWTTEVDVVALSNGGVYSRLATLPSITGKDRKRLNAKRIFTISSPHRGLRFGIQRIPFDAALWDVQPNSNVLNYLNEHFDEADYELICYAELNDEMVGAKNAAPPGRGSYWTDTVHLMSHISSAYNRRILTDIALRLRGEAPMTAEPSEPPRQ